jgi:hypothetical protein
MIHKLDYNKDGKVNFLDAAAYLTNLCGPYLIIITSIFAPNLEREFRGTLVTMGAAMAGTAQKEEKREELSKDLLDVAINAAVAKTRNELEQSNMDNSFYEHNDGTEDSGEPIHWS